MIKGMNALGPWMQVQYSTNAPYMNTSALSTGQIRYNPGMARLEVYDGVSWLEFGGWAEVGLNHDASTILTWAKKKMDHEQTIKELAETHPGVSELVKELTQAQEKLDIMIALLNKDSKNG